MRGRTIHNPGRKIAKFVDIVLVEKCLRFHGADNADLTRKLFITEEEIEHEHSRAVQNRSANGRHIQVRNQCRRPFVPNNQRRERTESIR